MSNDIVTYHSNSFLQFHHLTVTTLKTGTTTWEPFPPPKQAWNASTGPSNTLTDTITSNRTLR